MSDAVLSCEYDHSLHTPFSWMLIFTPALQTELDEMLTPFEGRDVVGIQIRLRERMAFSGKRVHLFQSVILIASGSDAHSSSSRIGRLG
jgi:hypothetical protein